MLTNLQSMDQQTLMSKISRFWEWFEESEHMFREVTDPQAVVEAMDNHILEFGMFAWEIGEGQSKPHYLLVSPNGDSKRLDISYKLIQAAPNLRHWEFHYCKPPKDWNFQFEIYDQFLVTQLIDASEWEYVLRKMEDNYVEVIIHADNMDNIDPEDKLNAAEMTLIKILGEELVIDHLGALEVVHEFSPVQEKRCQNMPTLKRNFEKMVGKSR